MLTAPHFACCRPGVREPCYWQSPQGFSSRAFKEKDCSSLAEFKNKGRWPQRSQISKSGCSEGSRRDMQKQDEPKVVFLKPCI